MARTRNAQKMTVDFLPLVVAAGVIGAFFLPDAHGLLGLLLLIGLLLSVVVIGLASGAAIWRNKQGQAAAVEGHGSDFFHPHAEPMLQTDSAEEEAAAEPEPEEHIFEEEDDEPAPPPPPTVSSRPPQRLAWRSELLQALEWKRFADVTAAYVRELGREARITRICANGAVEIEMRDRSTGQVEKVIRTLPWDMERIGIGPVWEFSEELDERNRIAEGAFFTAGDFTQEALIFARDNNLDLVDGREFLSRILQLPPSAQASLYEVAAVGDNTTPTCPNCGTKMMLRLAGKGVDRRRDHWSCRNYPRCSSTFLVVSNE